MEATLDVFTVGAALLALWVTARFGSLGPRSLGAALLLVCVALATLSVTTSATPFFVATTGTAGALLLDVLAPLTFAFWAWACLVRVLLGAIAPHRR